MNAFDKARSCKTINSILTHNFKAPCLLALHFARDNLTSAEAARRFASWLSYWAKKTAGGNFPYVKLVEYGPHSPRCFYLVVDLPKDVCENMLGFWSSGKAECSPIDAAALSELTQRITGLDPHSANSRRWSASHGLTYPPS